MKRLAIAVVLVLLSCVSYADTADDLVATAKRHIAKSEYKDALAQLDVAISWFDRNNVKSTNDRYLHVSKLKDRCERCNKLYSSILSYEKELTNIDAQFLAVSSEQMNTEVRDNLLSKLSQLEQKLKEIKSIWKNLDAGVTDNNVEMKLGNLDAQRAHVNKCHGEYVLRMEWDNVCQQNNKQAFKDFLNQHPYTVYSNVAKQKIGEFMDEEAWADAKKANTLISYRAYLKSYPSGKYRDSARSNVAKLEDEAAWNNAKAGNNLAAYKSYKSKYPQGKYAAEAASKIDVLQRQAKEQKTWETVCRTNTIEAYENYIRTSKQKGYVEEARSKIKEIQVRQDREHWERIKNSTSPSVFSGYINKSGVKNYEKEARFMYHVLSARAESSTSAKLVHYKDAQKYGSLTGNDYAEYIAAQEEADYKNFMYYRNVDAGKTFVKKYPNSKHRYEVSDAVAVGLVKEMTMFNYTSKASEAKIYSRTRETWSQIEKAEKECMRMKKKYDKGKINSSGQKISPVKTSSYNEKVSRDEGRFVNYGIGFTTGYSAGNYNSFTSIGDFEVRLGQPYRVFNMSFGIAVPMYYGFARKSYYPEDNFALSVGFYTTMTFNIARFSKGCLYMSGGAGFDMKDLVYGIGEFGYRSRYVGYFARYAGYVEGVHSFGVGIRILVP